MTRPYNRFKKHRLEKLTGLSMQEIADLFGLKNKVNVYQQIKRHGVKAVAEKVEELKEAK